MFTATPRQERFRALVGLLLVEDDAAEQELLERWRDNPIGDQPKMKRRWKLSDWCRASALGGDSVTPAEYAGWEQQDGFVEWWWSTQAAYAPVTQAEVLYADRAFFESVVDGMGDASMARVYGAVKAAKKGSDEAPAMSDEMRELMEHFAAMAKMNPYLVGAVPAEAK